MGPGGASGRPAWGPHFFIRRPGRAATGLRAGLEREVRDLAVAAGELAGLGCDVAPQWLGLQDLGVGAHAGAGPPRPTGDASVLPEPRAREMPAASRAAAAVR